MQNTLALELLKLIGSVVGLAAGIFVTYWQIRQRTKTNALKLEDNPERCGRHEEAIKTLRADMEKFCNENREDHKQIFAQLGAMSIELVKLGKNGGAAK